MFLKSILLTTLITLSICTGCDSQVDIEKSKQTSTASKIQINIGTVGSDVLDEIRSLQPFIKYLNNHSELSSYHFSGTAATNKENLYLMMKNKKIDIYIDSPFPIVSLKHQLDIDILLRRWKKGVKEYHSVIFTHKESGIETLDDLEEKVLAFEDPSSTGSYALPKAMLIKNGKSLQKVMQSSSPVSAGHIGYIFSQDDSNTILWVVKKKVPAGAINNITFAQIPEAHKRHLKVIHKTQSIARHLIAARPNLNKKFIETFTAVLLKMHQEELGKKALKEYEKTSRFDQIPAKNNMIKQISEILSIL